MTDHRGEFFGRLVSVILCMVLLTGLFSFPGTLAYAKEEKRTPEEERVREVLDSMTLEEKVGQMILAYKSKSNGLKQFKNYQFGGVVLFAEFFENSTPAAVSREVASWQKASKVPMLISVDEEGGTINRVSKYSQFRRVGCASPQVLYANGGWNRIRMDTAERAVFLSNLGINTNLAPVADTPYSSADYMYPRAFSTNAGETARYVRLVTEEYNNMKFLSSLKHFPGYGNNANTHNAVVRDHRSKDAFVTRDLIPFEAGIEAGAPMVMVSHNIVEAYDTQNPASISETMHTLLREDLHFDGVIVTDGLEMKGVETLVGDESRVAVLAVTAGNDMLCTGRPVTHYNAVLEAVKNGTISEEQINDSVRRILTMKLNYGLFD